MPLCQRGTWASAVWSVCRPVCAASTAHLTRPPKHPHLSLESRLRGSRLGGDFYPTSPSSAIVFAVQPWASDTCRNTCHKRDIGVFTL